MLRADREPRSHGRRPSRPTRRIGAALRPLLAAAAGRRRGFGRGAAGMLPACALALCLGRGESVLAQRLSLRLDRPELVNPAIEKAIESGIQYLLSVRQPEGHWENSGGRSGRRNTSFPCANTALVGLVLLAHGSTPTRGPHARVVDDITDQLLDYSTSLAPDAAIFQAPRGEYRPMYSHAFAMTFLATVFGQEGDRERRERMRDVLRKGITLCRRAQSPDGGWGYHANWEEPEGTLVVTQLMGLRACRDAGIPVSKSMIDNAIDFIRLSAQSDGWVRYRAHNSRQIRKGVTCAAVVALWQAGEYDTHLTRTIRDRVLLDIADETAWLWSNEDHGEYVEYYLAQVMLIQGDEQWKQHYRQIAAYLVTQQEHDGSWYGTDDSRRYGEIYATTMALLILQLPYNRLPIYQR